MGLRAVSEWMGTEEPRQAAIAAVASIDGTVVIVVKYSVLALGQHWSRDYFGGTAFC